jgi:putative peptidoglycan lipid II flippase
VRVAQALACLAPGLLMFSMNNILARAFYALGDIKTPMKISVVCLGLNLAFAVWLVQRYRESGLAVANTLSACFNLLLLVYALRRKLSRLGLTQLRRTLLILIPAAAIAALVAAMLSSLWERQLGHARLPMKLGAVFVPGGIATLLYWLFALWARVPAAHDILSLIKKRFGGHAAGPAR